MKYLSILILPFILCFQTAPKFAVLDATDPIIGEWEWIKDPVGSPYAPLPDLDWTFISFSAGNKQSMGAISYDETVKGYGCPSYFLAYTNGTAITATISDCCIAGDKGKKVNFNYSYDATEDQLNITVKGETFSYKRKKR
jgi:hypothetical protein